MQQKLRRVFASGRRILIANAATGDVRLGTVDDLLLVLETPIVAYDLERALLQFCSLVGGDVTEFRAWQISQIAGMSTALLDQWIAQGIICPSIRPPAGSGNHTRERLFSFDDAFLAGVLGALRRQGIRRPGLKCVSNFLRSFDDDSTTQNDNKKRIAKNVTK